MTDTADTTDLDEFLGIAQGGSSVPKKLRHSGEVAGDPELVPKEFTKDETGKRCQYARIGPGYIPTTSTIQKLPSGVYRIEKIGPSFAFVSQNVVTDNLLRLPDSRSEEIVLEIERFWTLKAIFKRFGFVHKRGILMFGKPGSGKTTTVNVVSQRMVQNGGLVILGSVQPGVLADMLAGLREVEPDRPLVVVLEDIDTLISSYGEQAILNMLDGEMTIDNVCFLATTNYPENLDGRIINRPSRFDRIVKIGMPSPDAREMYLVHCNTPLTKTEIKEWVRLTPEFSLAQLKELIVGVFCFEHTLEDEVGRLTKMMKKVSSSDFERSAGFSAPEGEQKLSSPSSGAGFRNG